MNFNEYLNSLDLANLNDLQPNEGMEMGWYKCKEEVLEIIKCIDYQHIDNIIEKIKKL